MAAIRVFLLTCRRPRLLPRALASLRAQTFTDWICELHNDDPDDPFPATLVRETADPRIILCQHTRNWGPVAAFNHALSGGSETYATILEDDNWWEPAFLAETHAALAAEPAASVVWSNMHLWQEEADGSWSDTGRTIWSGGSTAPRLFHWPQPRQCFDALHSNGAMLYRAAVSRRALVPAETPFAIIEPVRERLLSGGWLFLPRPLANFALTRGSTRARHPGQWLNAQLLVAGSYLRSVRPDAAEMAGIWQTLRAQNPPATNLLFQLACSGISPGTILRHARWPDIRRFVLGAGRHPLTFLRALRFRSTSHGLWPVLLAAAQARQAESAALPAGPRIYLKQLD